MLLLLFSIFVALATHCHTLTLKYTLAYTHTHTHSRTYIYTRPAVGLRYYYLIQGPRDPEKIARERRKRGSQANLTLDQCLLIPQSRRRCGFRERDINTMTALLCGSGPPCDCVGPKSRACSRAQRWAALRIAVANLRHQFVVVGIHSHLPAFVRVLECMLPLHFSGVSSVALPLARTTSGGYPFPSNRTQRVLERMLDLDMILYEHAKTRFLDLAIRCGVDVQGLP